jgi:hypothetical protein
MSVYLVDQILMLLSETLKDSLIELGGTHVLHAPTGCCNLPLRVSALRFGPVCGVRQLICPFGVFRMDAKCKVEHRGCYLLVPEKQVAPLVERK